MKNYLYLMLLIGLISVSACNNQQEKTTNDNSTKPSIENTEIAEPIIPVYYAIVGIYDEYGGARLKFLRDHAVYTLQKKYTYIDTEGEIHIADSLQLSELKLSDLNEFTPYVMQLNLYDNQTPTGTNFQVIKVSFTNSEATSVSRADVADRPSYSEWDRNINMSDFPTCKTDKVECKAQNLIGNIVRLSFI